jgi:hypothetical protein
MRTGKPSAIVNLLDMSRALGLRNCNRGQAENLERSDLANTQTESGCIVRIAVLEVPSCK